MRRLFTSFALFPALVLALPAMAQPQGSGEGQTPSVTVDATTAFDDSSGPGFLLPGMQVTAGVDGGKTAQLTFSALTDLEHNLGQTQLSVALSAPFDKDTRRGVFLTQRGIPTGFAAEGSVTRLVSVGDQETRTPPLLANTGAGFLDRSLIVVTGTVGVGVERFKYRSPTTFAESEQWETAVSFSLSGGYMPANSASFFAGGVEFRRRFKAPDPRVICPPASTTAPFECTQAVFGPPAREEDAAIFAVARTLDLFGIVGPAVRLPFALELRAAYDFDDNSVGLEAPVYVFLDSDRKYRGGFSIGWDSDENDVRFGFFIGVALDFLGTRQ